VTGTILVLINHVDVFINGQFSELVLVKIMLTYLVPYSAATYAAVAAIVSNNE